MSEYIHKCIASPKATPYILNKVLRWPLSRACCLRHLGRTSFSKPSNAAPPFDLKQGHGLFLFEFLSLTIAHRYVPVCASSLKATLHGRFVGKQRMGPKPWSWQNSCLPTW